MSQWADFYREKFQGAVVVEKEDGFFWGYPQEGYFMIGDCYVIPEKRNKGLWMEYHKELEYEAISAGLARTNWNMTATAQQLGISRMTLYRKLDQHGLRKKDE